jgi:hypothetical protein
MSLSELIDKKIADAIQHHKYSEYGRLASNPFEELISFGELVDRLSIVNYKLYDLKNEVIRRPGDQAFLAAAAIKDVALVEERARLKRCIDAKLISMIKNPNFNPEVKSYGKNFND